MKTIYKKLGALLKENREKRGMTQTEVARALGYSNPQFVSNSERGLCRLPFEAISKLARLYAIDPETIIQLFLKEDEARYREVFKAAGRAPKKAKTAKKTR